MVADAAERRVARRGEDPMAARRGRDIRREVALQNPGRFRGLPLARLRPWLVVLLEELSPGASSLAVRFLSDGEMERLNAEYRGKPGTTDVLSFPGETTVEGRHLGDIAVSVPAARRQAETAGHGLERELRLLLLHGVLHCLGHDHETDAGEMDALEGRLRRRFLDRKVPA